MSQTELADRMRARGWKWTQGTVSSIENGERPLRLAEAADLAAVLGFPGDNALQFLRTDDHARFELWNREMRDATDALSAAAQQYLGAQEGLALAADQADLTDEEREQTREAIDEDPVAIAQRAIALRPHTAPNPTWDEFMRSNDVTTLSSGSLVRRLMQARTAAGPGLRYAGTPPQRVGRGLFRQVRIDDGEHSETPER